MFGNPLLFIAALCILATPCLGQQVDSDRDGLSDQLEQSLLNQFQPTFMIGSHDCSNVPSEFVPGDPIPTVQSENSTIYGQVFPTKDSTPQNPIAEIHFYHLWRTDCGPHGHPLDTEHVATLVHASDPDLTTAIWTATYWYAAAHENTVCDVSQVARASTLKAEDHGAKIWISPGKHASYLNETICRHGCGADRCEQSTTLHPHGIINLGEPGHPMNQSVFIASTAWPLTEKMQTTNFPAPAIARLDRLPETDIAWFNPGHHPAQGVIAVSGTTGAAIATGGRNTNNALNTAGDSTDSAISLAADNTGNALHKSYRKTIHALGVSTRNVGKALHVAPDQPTANPDTQNPQP